MKNLITTLFFAVAASTSLSAIEYPFEAPKVRRELIAKHVDTIKAGMSSKAVIELIGKPDETTPLYEPKIKIKNPRQIGSTIWYILSQRQKDGSQNDKKKIAIAVRLDLQGIVSRVDRINYK
jgi:hypothetical protein